MNVCVCMGAIMHMPLAQVRVYCNYNHPNRQYRRYSAPGYCVEHQTCPCLHLLPVVVLKVRAARPVMAYSSNDNKHKHTGMLKQEWLQKSGNYWGTLCGAMLWWRLTVAFIECMLQIQAIKTTGSSLIFFQDSGLPYDYIMRMHLSNQPNEPTICLEW